MAFCAFCGGQMADGVAFCPNCGKAVSQGRSTGGSAAPVPAPESEPGKPTSKNDMRSENKTKVRGTIVKVPDSTPGLLFANGEQKAFTLEGVWKSPTAPAANMVVDVEFDAEKAITAITAVDSQQIAKERLNQLSGVAQEQGKQAARVAGQGIRALAARMGKVALGATVVLWVAWFFLPAVNVSLVVVSNSLTFWDLLGVDLSNPMTLGSSSHGLLAVIGLVAIAAPFAAPFIRHPRAQYLNAAPLAFLALIGLKIWWNIHEAVTQAQQALGGADAVMGQLGSQMMQAAMKEITGAFSVGVGTYVLVIASVVLALLALKRPRPASAP
jgi:hypothetical protein